VLAVITMRELWDTRRRMTARACAAHTASGYAPVERRRRGDAEQRERRIVRMEVEWLGRGSRGQRGRRTGDKYVRY
jgi:hypothetical protein